MVVFSAKGSVFCSGADLKAAMGMAEEHHSSIPDPKGEILIAELFNTIHKPTIAKIEGDVFAGGFFFLAGCNIVLAVNNVKLGLPEVKRGLFPFQVMAALLRVLPSRKVIDWCIRGYNLPVTEAIHLGLITKIVDQGKMDDEVNNIIDELKQNSPAAIRMGLEAYDHTIRNNTDYTYLMKMLSEVIATKDGVEGMQAFFERRKPQWTGD
jgi:enoyl-CoA hydratase/carnithine racemase